MSPHRKAFAFYQRKRVVNVNVNVIAGGLVAILIGAVVVKIVHRVWPDLSKEAYVLIGTAADIVADVALYFVLHWVANHWRPVKGHSEKVQEQLAAEKPPFWKDAGRVQIERAVLGPLFYLLSALGMWMLQRSGMEPGWAMILSFSVVLIVTRVIHTAWGLRSGTLVDHHRREGDNLRGTAPKAPAPTGGADCADSQPETGPDGAESAEPDRPPGR